MTGKYQKILLYIIIVIHGHGLPVLKAMIIILYDQSLSTVFFPNVFLTLDFLTVKISHILLEQLASKLACFIL